MRKHALFLAKTRINAKFWQISKKWLFSGLEKCISDIHAQFQVNWRLYGRENLRAIPKYDENRYLEKLAFKENTR